MNWRKGRVGLALLLEIIPSDSGAPNLKVDNQLTQISSRLNNCDNLHQKQYFGILPQSDKQQFSLTYQQDMANWRKSNNWPIQSELRANTGAVSKVTILHNNHVMSQDDEYLCCYSGAQRRKVSGQMH